MAQVNQVRQSRFLVGPDRRGDLDHGQEGEGSFLHPGSAGRGSGQQRQAFTGGPLDGVGQAVCGGHSDGAAQESKLADNQCHPAAPHQTFAGQHGFVFAGLLPGCREVRLIRVAVPGVRHRRVPGTE